MSKRIYIALALGYLVLAGCGPQPDDSAAKSDAQPSADAASPTESPWPDRREELGMQTYEAVCAGCHDPGTDGAPRTGVREDWSGRSDLWEAVLFRHARDGYLDMPGKGGSDELSDEAVNAASEYILEQTFPDRPRD